jgi:hypothetical protein
MDRSRHIRLDAVRPWRSFPISVGEAPRLCSVNAVLFFRDGRDPYDNLTSAKAHFIVQSRVRESRVGQHNTLLCKAVPLFASVTVLLLLCAATGSCTAGCTTVEYLCYRTTLQEEAGLVGIEL